MATEQRFDIRVNFEGVTFDDARNRLIELRLVEGVHQIGPILEIAFLSFENVFTDSPLFDGQLVSLTYRSTEKGVESPEEETTTFRVFNFKIRPTTVNEAVVHVSALIDLPDLYAARRESFHGTSGSVFHALADRMGVLAVADESADVQTWLRPGVQGGLFLNEVAEHAWNGPDSFFAWATRRSGELVLRDVARALAHDPADWNFTQMVDEQQLLADDDRAVFFIDPIFTSLSGSANNYFGYGKGLHNYTLADGQLHEITSNPFPKPTANLQLNRDLAAYRRYDSLPLLAGNTHPNFHNAFYQNSRSKSLFSSLLKVSSNFPRNCHLLETVDVHIPTLDTSTKNVLHSNRYLIAKIITAIDFTHNTLLAGYGLATSGFGGPANPQLY